MRLAGLKNQCEKASTKQVNCTFLSIYDPPIIQEIALPGLGAAPRINNLLHPKHLRHLISNLHLLQSQLSLINEKKRKTLNEEIYQ